MLEEPLTKSQPRLSGEPSDEELSAFVASTLSKLDRNLRGPDVIDELIRRNRELWVMLYRASSSAANALSSTQPPAAAEITVGLPM